MPTRQVGMATSPNFSLVSLPSFPLLLAKGQNHQALAVAVYSFFSATKSKLVPCICTRPTIVKKKSDAKAKTRFCKLQFSGSLGDGDGIGRRNVRPSEVMRKMLPGRTKDVQSNGSFWSLPSSIVGLKIRFVSL